METGSRSPVKILSVDDTPANLLAMRALLEPLDYDILDASSGEEALALAAREEFAVVLLDVMMPGLDGLETLARLRAGALLPQTPVIFVTARDLDLSTIERAYELGAVDYVTKPLTPEIIRGKIASFVALFKVSQQLRARDAALAMKDRHIAMLAHDLRNPLTTVITGMQLILRSDIPANVKRTSERIARAGARMSSMVRDLLDHARASAGVLQMNRTTCDLGLLCRELVEEFEVADAERHIVLHVSGDTRGHWDRARLYQALSNLVGNATHYGHGTAEMTVDGRGTDVEIAVRNSGPPIAPNLLPVLFEPFERGGTDGEGLGLGLYIVRLIARAHDGDISVQSSMEHGTRFVLRLPRALSGASDSPSAD